MTKIVFRKYQMSQILKIRKLSSAHYLPSIRQYSTPPHQHDSWELVFCSKGSVKVYIDSNLYTLHANQFLMYPPKTEHWFCVESAVTTMFLLSFACSSETLKLLLNTPLTIDKELRNHLFLIINELGNAFELQDGQLQLNEFHPSHNAPLGSEQMITCYLESFLIRLLRSITCCANETWTAQTLENALENHLTLRVKEYIAAHLSEPITLDSLANALYYSRSYLTSQFRNATGMSISQYVFDQRIEQAKKLLTDGEPLTLSQISLQLGFSSQQYFSKCFKEAVGCTPSSYAAAHKE